MKCILTDVQNFKKKVTQLEAANKRITAQLEQSQAAERAIRLEKDKMALQHVAVR